MGHDPHRGGSPRVRQDAVHHHGVAAHFEEAEVGVGSRRFVDHHLLRGHDQAHRGRGRAEPAAQGGEVPVEEGLDALEDLGGGGEARAEVLVIDVLVDEVLQTAGRLHRSGLPAADGLRLTRHFSLTVLFRDFDQMLTPLAPLCSLRKTYFGTLGGEHA